MQDNAHVCPSINKGTEVRDAHVRVCARVPSPSTAYIATHNMLHCMAQSTCLMPACLSFARASLKCEAQISHTAPDRTPATTAENMTLPQLPGAKYSTGHEMHIRAAYGGQSTQGQFSRFSLTIHVINLCIHDSRCRGWGTQARLCLLTPAAHARRYHASQRSHGGHNLRDTSVSYENLAGFLAGLAADLLPCRWPSSQQQV